MQASPIWRHRIDRRDGLTVVALAGELDVAACDDLRALLWDEITRPGTVGVEADLGEVTFLDSSALGSLVSAHSVAHDSGSRFFVTNATRGVRRVLEVTGLFDVLGPQ